MGCPREFYHRFIYIAPSSTHSLLTLKLPLKWFKGGFRLFTDVWGENAALFKRLMKFIQMHQYYTMALRCHNKLKKLVLYFAILKISWKAGNVQADNQQEFDMGSFLVAGSYFFYWCNRALVCQITAALRDIINSIKLQTITKSVFIREQIWNCNDELYLRYSNYCMYTRGRRLRRVCG